MYFNVNSLRRIEPPKMVLTNPDGTDLYLLTDIHEVKGKYSLVELSEITFKVYKCVNGVELEYYDYLENKRKIKVEGVGDYIVTSVTEENDGVMPCKEVTMQSAEIELKNDSLYNIVGTYQLYSWVKPEGTLLNEVLKVFPNWTVGRISDDIFGKYRTFDVSETDCYEWLIGDCAKAYECVFIFDAKERTISALSPQDFVSETDIMLSYETLLKKTNISSSSEDIFTVLSVEGDEELSIGRVNPMGDSRIYNFSYYKNSRWMTQDLIDALTSWEEKIKRYKKPYADAFTVYIKSNTELTKLNVELDKLKSNKKNYETVREVRIEQGLNTDEIDSDIQKVELEISSKQSEIDAKEAEKERNSDRVQTITIDCSFETNFTVEQYKALCTLISKKTYQNSTFLVTDVMSEERKQEQCEGLMEQAESVLSNVCKPQSTFDIDAMNFLVDSKYDIYREQFELGSVVAVDMGDGNIAHPVLLTVTVNYDNTSSFDMTFSEDLRMRGGVATYAQLFGEVYDLSSSASSKASSALKQNINTSDRLNTVYEGVYVNANDILISGVTTDVKIEQVKKTLGTANELLAETNKKVLETEAIVNANKDDWDKVKGITNDLGNVITERLEGTIKTGQNQILNANSTVKFDDIGILATNLNGTLATRLSSAGLLIANSKLPDGTWNWRTAITGSGISADEINTGTLRAITIDGVTITGTEIRGGTITAGTQISAPSLVGGTISGAEVNGVKINGGTITGMEMTANKFVGNEITGGSISGITMTASAIVGGTMDVGNSKLKVGANNVVLKGSSGTMTVDDTGINIDGATLKVRKMSGGVERSLITLSATDGIKIQKKEGTQYYDKFYVDTDGNAVFAGKITGGEININGMFMVDSGGNCTANSLRLTGTTTGNVDANTLRIDNLIVGKNVSMGANATITWQQVTGTGNVAEMSDLTWSNIKNRPTIPTLPSYITSTKITQTSIESPNITGGVITGGILQSYHSGGAGIMIDEDSVNFYSSGTSRCGYIMYDTSGAGTTDEARNRLLFSSTNGYALKIQSSGNMSLGASGGHIYIGGYGVTTHFIGNVSGVTATFG